MIGGLIENLKSPKNAFSSIIIGWIFCIIGYIILRKTSVPLVAKIFGGLGLVMISLAIVRLALTKLVLYGVVLGILVVGYWSAYLREKKWEPKKKIKIAAFAPAMMTSAIVLGKIKGQSLYEKGLPWKENLGEHNELRESTKN